ncbi:MAG TPA: gephyrin-like molybdotransferase Glp [Candidatus Limnocylindrales bacterium]|nr:gephyrin-like molybdotransferase Glp [Candidatus Limnocylindrales bacterium]
MLTVAEARQRILAPLTRLPGEEVAVREAHDRVLAESVTATTDVPPFANSAMDGYAVIAGDVAQARPDRPVRLAVAGEVRAGFAPAHPVRPGTAVRIMTGAAIPDGADAVVRVEDTAEGDHEVLVQVPVEAGTSLRAAGSDLRAGEVVAREGQVLTPGVIGVCAAAGRRRLRCVRRPRVLVLTTGDELREPGEPLQPGQIVNTNRYALAAAVAEAGGVVVDAGVARDERAQLAAALQRASEADLVVTSGGVSMGSYDLVRDLLAQEGAIDFWQVALRPGKPLAFGRIHDVPMIGLPGNPVSSLVTFELFARPALLRMQGREDRERPRLTARTDSALVNPPHLEQYFRGIARHGPDGLRVALTGDQGSHVLRSMADANCLVVVPQGTSRVPAGAEVEIMPLAPID